MEVARRDYNGITVVAPTGRIDTMGAAALACALEARASAHHSRLVVDMGGVDYIGSKGLQALLEALAACRRLGGDLKLAAVSPNVLHILRMIKFDELFSICEAVDQAVAEFG